ncbi:hypothetical protein Tco_0810704 [Tanacetum coccineum]
MSAGCDWIVAEERVGNMCKALDEAGGEAGVGGGSRQLALVIVDTVCLDIIDVNMELILLADERELQYREREGVVSQFEDIVILMVDAAGLRQVKIHRHMLILDRHIDEVLKLKNFKKDERTSFQGQEKYEHVGPKVTSTQDGKRSQDDDSRLYLADDLKEAQVHMQVNLKGTSSGLKSKDHYAYHKLKDKDSRPRAKTKDIHRM